MVTVLGQDLLTIFFLQTFLIRNLLVICMFVCLCEREKNRKTERERENVCVLLRLRVKTRGLVIVYGLFLKHGLPLGPGAPRSSGSSLPAGLRNSPVSPAFGKQVLLMILCFFKWPLQFKSRSPSLPGKHFMN